MVTMAERIARGSELKRALVLYGQQPRYERAYDDALRARNLTDMPETDSSRVMFLDYFVLQHRFRNGRTVVEQFLAAHPELSEEDRSLLLGWRDVVEGIFEILDRDGDALVVRGLADDLTYRVHSNNGPQVFDDAPTGAFLVTRLLPVGDEWLISAAAALVPASQRAQLERHVAALTGRPPTLRNATSG